MEEERKKEQDRVVGAACTITMSRVNIVIKFAINYGLQGYSTLNINTIVGKKPLGTVK